MSKAAAEHIYDVIIVGGGAAGCSAALTLARCNRRILIIDAGAQRNRQTKEVHLFLTRDGIPPAEFLSLAQKELEYYSVQTIKSRVIFAKELAGHGFTLTDANNNKYTCRRLLLATGVTDEIPDVPGMKELWGHGVYHCPYCDGWEYTGKTIGLYAPKHGYGMALALRQLSPELILFTNGRNYLKTIQREYLDRRGIKVVAKPIRELTHTDTTIRGVTLDDDTIVPVDVLFVINYHRVNNELLTQLGCRCVRKGAAITNRRQETNIPGVYVAGDASYDMHMVVVAAAEGVKAAVAINNSLLKKDNELTKR
jgi:thioredoxin reductase